MTTMTKSIWKSGTYDLLISNDPEGKPGDLMFVFFAAPSDPDDEVANRDAPVLSHIDVESQEYAGKVLELHHYGMMLAGEEAFVKPEDYERIFGTALALRLLLGLWQAADADFRGMDMDDQPWRLPNEEAVFPLMQRVHTLLMDISNRLG